MSEKPHTQTTPKTKEDWFQTGVEHFQKHQFSQAGKCFDEALKFDHQYLSAICGKGNVLATQDKFEQAITYFDDALQIDKNCIEAINGQGNIYLVKGELETALGLFEKIIQIDSEYTLAWYGKASIHAQKNELDSALECYEKVLAQDSNNIYALNGKGSLMLRQNKQEEALECYQKMLEIDPANSLAWFNRGSLLFDFQRYAESKASMVRSYLHATPTDFESFAIPFFRNFVERFHSPALLYRIIWHDYPQFISQEDFTSIAQTIFDNYADLADILLFIKSKESDLPEYKQRVLSAVIALFHGDPLLGAELISDLAGKNLPDLHLQSLLFLALDGFMEKNEEQEKRVYKHLKSLNPEDTNPETCYYAGQLYFRKGDLEQADRYFKATTEKGDDYQLAAYCMRCYCANIKGDQATEEKLFFEILNLEKKLYQEGKVGFLQTTEKLEIDLEKADWSQPFYYYKQLLEITGALILFQNKLKEKDTVDKLQADDPSFDYSIFMENKLRQGTGKWWMLSDSTKSILSDLEKDKRNSKINSLLNEIKEKFELKKNTADQPTSPQTISLQIREELKKNPQRLNDIHLTLQIANLREELSLQEMLLLMFDTLFAYYSATLEENGSNQTPLFKDGLKTGFIAFLSSLSNSLLVDGLAAHKALLSFSLIGGISQTFYEAFFSSPQAEIPTSFTTIQKLYSKFVQTQKEELGEKFYRKYPVFDFGLLTPEKTEVENSDKSKKLFALVKVLGELPQITLAYEETAENIYSLFESLPDNTKKQAVQIIEGINPIFAHEIREDYLS